MYVCIGVYLHEFMHLHEYTRMSEAFDFPEAGVTGCCETPDVHARNETHVLGKSSVSSTITIYLNS